ncbi:MAG TPA: hypothetical protein VGG72_04050 [Bryobacteraceae bacterium]
METGDKSDRSYSCRETQAVSNSAIFTEFLTIRMASLATRTIAVACHGKGFAENILKGGERMVRDFWTAWNSLRLAGIAALSTSLCVPLAMAQDHDYRDRDRDHGRLTRIEPGTQISVRTAERIDVNRFDNHVYPGRVESDVYGENGRLAIPRGAPVQLMVRVAPDNDLVLDLESITVHGDRFAVDTTPDRIQSERQYGMVGAIVGAIKGAQVRGPAVTVPRDTALTFQIDRPLVVHAVDRDHPYSDYDHPYGE